MDMLEKLSLAGLVPVIKIEDANDAVPLCRALLDGGLPVAEITFRTAAAAQAIANVNRELPEILLGAGTVLTTEQVDRALAAGAKYIVAPGLNPQIVRYCQNIGVAVLPGCVNPSDIELALSLGLKTLKFFPAEAAGGLAMIKALAAPYGDVTFVPTGGINEKNLLEYLSFPKIVACGGSWMVPDGLIKAKDWGKIRDLTRNAVNLLHGFELRHIGINFDEPEAAMEVAHALAEMFTMPVKEGAGGAFVGTAFEIMKKRGRGQMGHIAIGVNSVPRARAYLESRGYTFIEDTASYKEDKLAAIYFEKEFGGFAMHLVQKQ